MKRRPTLLPLLLAAALLAGPVLAASHDAEHGLQPGAAHACVVCLYAHGAGHGAVPAAPVVLLTGTVEAPETLPAAGRTGATLRLNPIRGPPARLS